MKICKKCKKEFDNEKIFCIECGEKLEIKDNFESIDQEEDKITNNVIEESKEKLALMIDDNEHISKDISNLNSEIERIKIEKEQKKKKKLEEEKNKLLEALKKLEEENEEKNCEINLNEKSNSQYKKESIKENSKKRKKILMISFIIIITFIVAIIVKNKYTENAASIEVETRSEEESINNNEKTSTNDSEESSTDDSEESSIDDEENSINKIAFGDLTNSKDKKMALSVESVKDITKELKEETKKGIEDNEGKKFEQYLLITYGYKNININEKIMESPESVSDSEGNIYSGFRSLSGFKSPIYAGKGKQQLDAQKIIALDKKIEGNIGIDFSSYYDKTRYEFYFEGKIS